MEKKPVIQAEKYYKLIGEKKVEEVKQYLHPDIEFYAPLTTLKGKQAVMEAISNFMKAFTSLTIRAKFGEKDQAMVVYEVNIPGVAKDFPSASLLNFREGLIARIQLFYDGSLLLKNRDEISSKTTNK